jgi:hypothetical protein
MSQSRVYARPRMAVLFKRQIVIWILSTGVIAVPLFGWGLALAMVPFRFCYEFLLFEEVRMGAPIDRADGRTSSGGGILAAAAFVLALISAGVTYSVGTPPEYLQQTLNLILAPKQSQQSEEKFPPPPPILVEVPLPPDPSTFNQAPLIPNAVPAKKPVQVNPKNHAG